MRGKAHPLVAFKSRPGITPAYAGKSKPSELVELFSWDHPRVCGEKFDLSHHNILAWGSPPRMRGKGCGSAHTRMHFGITPAYAGKSSGLHRGLIMQRDHPRVCGEKKSCRIGGAWQLGSPPRMRGKAFASSTVSADMRITPAYAGKSASGTMNGSDT